MTSENIETQNDIPLDEQIKLQEENIEKYKDILRRYQSGRWYDLYRRTLHEKEDHLRALREKWEQETKNSAEFSFEKSPAENKIRANTTSLSRVVKTP